MPKAYKLKSDVEYTKGGIPKIFHQIWIGSDVPPVLKLIMSSFKKMEGYKYKLWKNKDVTQVNFPITWSYIVMLMSRPKIVWAMIADLLRLEILYHHGGIYIDTTAEALQNFDPILENSSKFIMSNEQECGLKCKSHKGKFISNSFIASVPQYIVIKRLLSNEYLENINFDDRANVATGPYYVRKGIHRASDVKMLPTKYIYPLNGTSDVAVDECVSETKKKGFLKRKYFKKDFYVKFPCDGYPGAYMVKNWAIGGTWI